MCAHHAIYFAGLTLEEMDDVFGATQSLAVADQERQTAIFRRLGLFDDVKEEKIRKSDEESHEADKQE